MGKLQTAIIRPTTCRSSTLCFRDTKHFPLLTVISPELEVPPSGGLFIWTGCHFYTNSSLPIERTGFMLKASLCYCSTNTIDTTLQNIFFITQRHWMLMKCYLCLCEMKRLANSHSQGLSCVRKWCWVVFWWHFCLSVTKLWFWAGRGVT